MTRCQAFPVFMLALVVAALLPRASWADAQERVQITSPRDGAYVTRIVAVKGTVSLKRGEVLVILARHAEYGWWYQGQTETTGAFEIEPVTIGSPSDVRGARFSIAAFIVPAGMASEMKGYRSRLGVPVSPHRMITVYRL